MAIIKSTSAGGDFSAPTAWLGGVVPAATDTVILAGPVTINDTRACENGGSITADNGAGQVPRYNELASLAINGELDLNAGGTLDLRGAGHVYVNNWLNIAGGTFLQSQSSGSAAVATAAAIYASQGALVTNLQAMTYVDAQSVAIVNANSFAGIGTIRQQTTDGLNLPAAIERPPLAFRFPAGGVGTAAFSTPDAEGSIQVAPDAIPVVGVFRASLIGDENPAGFDSAAVITLHEADGGMFLASVAAGDAGDGGQIEVLYTMSGTAYRQTIYFQADALVADVQTQTAKLQFDAGNNVKSVLAPTGLDAISIAPPTGVAGTFREMLVQLWRRFYRKATKDRNLLNTYADDGTTVLTTQAVSDDGTTETQGAAG